MSIAFDFGNGYRNTSDRPVPPPLKCKACGSSYQPSGGSFDLTDGLGSKVANDDSKCPECNKREKIAEANTLKLELAKKSKDVITPATFAQFEELIQIARKNEENSRSIRTAIWGIWWGLFGMWALACIGYLIVGY